MDKNKKNITIKNLYNEYGEFFAGEELVYGDGNCNSGIVMIGEAPGKDEVRLKKPFVGLAGGKLKEFIDYINLKREDIFVTNAIKYRLFKINPKTNNKSNRPAKINEIKSSIPYLDREMQILKPKIIITLGNVPLKAVTGQFKLTIGQVHGKVLNTNGLDVFPLYHPASLIYNRKLEKTYFEDLDRLIEVIKEIKT